MRFRPGVALTLLAAILVPTGIALGLWQLQRADDKRNLEERYLAGLGGLAVGESMLREAPEGMEFRLVTLEGRYEDERQFLVDNRTHRGSAGYWVFTPFRATGGTTFLVNRGWIEGNGRERLPDPPAPSGIVQIRATLWPDMGGIRFGADEPWTATWPKRVAHPDVERMATAIGGAFPAELRLDEGSPGLLEPVRAAVEFDTERHVGYAVQWFALAAAVAIAWLALGYRAGRRARSGA